MKYFLPCEHCAHNNEVTSEYLTFCEFCSKKLSLNFRDWQKKHRDATLTEYMENVCVSEEHIEKQAKAVQSTQKDGWSHWIGISITLSVIFGVGLFVLFVYANVREFTFSLEPRTYSTPDPSAWKKSTYGSLGLNIDCPFDLTLVEIPLPEHINEVVESMQSFVGQTDDKKFIVLVNSIKYHPEIGSVKLQAALTGSVEAMKFRPGVTNFKFSQSAINLTGRDGFRQDGSYYEHGIKMDFTSVGFGEGLVLWQILVSRQADNPVLTDLTERVINSVDIQYNSSI